MFHPVYRVLQFWSGAAFRLFDTLLALVVHLSTGETCDTDYQLASGLTCYGYRNTFTQPALTAGNTPTHSPISNAKIH